MDSYNTTVPMNQAQQLGLVPPRLPVPDQQAALPEPPVPEREQQQMLTFDNFARILADDVDNQRRARPPPEWGRNLIDDDDDDGPRMPTSPIFSRLSKPSDLEFDIDFANELENSIAEVYGTDPSDPEIKQTGKEMQQILKKVRAGVEAIQAKRFGTLHANKKMVPRGKYKDTERRRHLLDQDQQVALSGCSPSPWRSPTPIRSSPACWRNNKVPDET
jgi:hypothetical protein